MRTRKLLGLTEEKGNLFNKTHRIYRQVGKFLEISGIADVLTNKTQARGARYYVNRDTRLA